MPLIYGSGFKPGKLISGEVKEKEKKTTSDFFLFTALRVLTAVAFIALSFIPIAGEVGQAALLAGEAEIEAIDIAAEAAIETAVTSSESANIVSGAANTISRTAITLRLGDTISGSVGLGLAEAATNEALDRIEGVSSAINTTFNFALAFTPLYGAIKGRRLANVRFAQTVDRQIEQQYEILKLASTSSQKAQVELRIRQLKNSRFIRTKRIFSSEIDSFTARTARKETLRVIENETKNSTKVTVKKVANELKKNLSNNEIRLSKTEARNIVRSVSRTIPSVSEGITIKGIVQSRTYNRVLNIMRWIDPNMAARKVWTGAARKLTTNEALFRVYTKSGTKEYGKWFKGINLGYYKRFGKKLSKWWRKWGAKIYKHSRVRMIPVVSKWIDGYRLVDTPVPGEYIMIVIFKPSPSGRVPSPVIVNPVTLVFAEEFATGGEYGSVGSFYINRIALARNGSGPSISGSLASILGPLSLGTLRNALATPAAFERLIRKVTKGDFFSTYFDNITETSNRLWSHKVGKIVAGRWGIATARGFQSTHNGHTSLGSSFDVRHLIDEMGIVTLDKARSVQRKAGIQGRTSVIGSRRITNQYKRTVKLATFGYAKYDGNTGFKKGNGIFSVSSKKG